MIKECLRKVNTLKTEMNSFNKTINTEIYERLNYIQKEVSDHKVSPSNMQSHLEDVAGRLGTMEKK